MSDDLRLKPDFPLIVWPSEIKKKNLKAIPEILFENKLL